MDNIENLPVPKDLGRQNKRHHNIAVVHDRPVGKFLKNGRLLRNEKRSGAGKYNYGVPGDETKVYVNEQEGLLNKELINHDAQIIDQSQGKATVSVVPPKEDEHDEDEWEEGEEGEEYYDEEGEDWGEEEQEQE